MNKFTYTNAQKDEMQERVISIAEALTNDNWKTDGAYVTNSSCTKAINVYDYMDVLTFYHENGTLEQYLKELIEEQEKEEE